MTIQNNEKINVEDAQRALNTVSRMEHASLQQSIPPRWLGVVMALAIGLLVFTIAAGLRDYYVFPIIAIPLILATYSAKTKARPKTMPIGMKGVIAVLGIIAILLSLIIGGRLFMEIYALTWAPKVAGIFTAVLVYLISLGERNEHLKRINNLPNGK